MGAGHTALQRRDCTMDYDTGYAEKQPLIKTKDFRGLTQDGELPVVQCCCVESYRLGKVPIIRTLFKKEDAEEKGTFSSSFGVLLSMLGSVVGTGNIWRFPRIMANNAINGGALAFLLVWFLFLWIWSLPIILIEYGVGRFTKKSTVESFGTMIGPSYRFMGGIQAVTGICTGSYYSVLVGWCGYYFIVSCAQPLPVNLTMSNHTWTGLQDSYWPIACHGLSIGFAALSILGGVATIEPVNKVIVPILLVIVAFSFYWAIFLPNASDGIIHMFTPNWGSLKSSQVWLDAISQNAWDTGSGSGSFLNLATFMKRSQGAVRLGTITPLLNNLVSLMCGILVFSTVFSVQRGQGRTPDEVVETLRYNGPGNSGLTFIWMPLLYGSVSGGRVLAALFFLCITFAGISSLISIIERPVHVLADFGIKRIPATVLVALCMFALGTASALDAKILVNQDTVWAYALILSGCFLLFLVIRYGALRFRREVFNEYGINDWPLPFIWVIVVVCVAPFEGVGLILWWIVDQIRNNPDTWWQLTVDSLATVLTEWAVVFCVLIGLNWWIAPITIYEPKDKYAKKILGLFFTLSRRPSTPSPPPPLHTPTTESFPSAAFAMSGKKEDEKKADLASEDQTQSDVKL